MKNQTNRYKRPRGTQFFPSLPANPEEHDLPLTAPPGPSPKDMAEEVSMTPSPKVAVGEGGSPVCRCGAPRSANNMERCTGGHLIRGNTASVKSGARSMRFMDAIVESVAGISQEVLADLGYPNNPLDAPAILRKAAVALARAEVLAESFWWRVVETGGPLSGGKKVRLAYMDWIAADKRAESWAKMIGVKRVGGEKTFADLLGTAGGGLGKDTPLPAHIKPTRETQPTQAAVGDPTSDESWEGGRPKVREEEE